MKPREELLQKMTIWRNASKPMLYAISTGLSNLSPNDSQLSAQADKLVFDLLEVLDNYIYNHLDSIENVEDENSNPKEG